MSQFLVSINDEPSILDKKDSKKWISSVEFYSTILVLGGLGILLYTYSLSYNCKLEGEDRGQFGDFVGGVVGSMWALAGVILFYAALKQQRIDNKDNNRAIQEQNRSSRQQINALRAQISVMSRSNDLIAKQLSTQNKQQFEATFFSSLRFHEANVININYQRKISNPFEYEISKSTVPWARRDFEPYLGRESFQPLYSEYKYKFQSTRDNKNNEKSASGDDKNTSNNIQTNLLAVVNESYLDFFREHQASLGHYFRTIYQIVKLVDNYGGEDAKYYTNFLRAQFSTYEHILLFYNCLSDMGRERFHPLIIKYQLLNNLNKKELIHESHIELYPKKAYE
jgi:hypothetical protein